MTTRTSALRAFMSKEARHILRDRQTLTILILLPLAMVVLFGFALRNDITAVRILVVDPAPDYATIALRAQFEGNPRFCAVAVTRTDSGISRAFRRGDADMALVFRPGFASDRAADVPAQVNLVNDASDPNTASQMAAYARAVIGAYESRTGTNVGAVQIVPQVRMRYNPTLASVNLFVPGLIALVLTLVTALMTAISLSREKERGTLEILLVSPLRPWEIILGKVLPYLVLAMANVVTALLAAWLIFHVPFRGSVLLLFAASLLYSMVGLSLGVLIAALTASQRAAMLGAMAGTMLPSTLLSGMIFPIASLPGWLVPVTYIIPARWFIIISRGIMLQGVGVSYIWRDLAVLTLMLAVLLTAAIRAFRPRLG